MKILIADTRYTADAWQNKKPTKRNPADFIVVTPLMDRAGPIQGRIFKAEDSIVVLGPLTPEKAEILTVAILRFAVSGVSKVKTKFILNDTRD